MLRSLSVFLTLLSMLYCGAGFSDATAQTALYGRDASQTAATVGGRAFTVAQLGYYYYPTVRMYQQYGITLDREATESLRQNALDSLHEYASIAAAAEADGYLLSEEGAAGVDADIALIKSHADQYGSITSAYIQNVYGPYMDEETLRGMLEMEALAKEYYAGYTDSLAYSDEQYAAYYQAHADTLDTFTFSAAFYLNEDPAGGMEEETLTLPGVALCSYFGCGDNDCVSWLTAPGRKRGDTVTIETDRGRWVLKFDRRFLDEESWGDVDVRHILVMAEVAEGAEEPAAEAMEAAKAKARDILDRFNAGGKTAEDFAALAREYSEDPDAKDDGGLYEHVTPSTNFFDGFKSWIFDDARKPGDTGLVENTQPGRRGWHVMYLDRRNELQWRFTAFHSMKSSDTTAWMSDVMARYPLVPNEDAPSFQDQR